MYNNASLLVVNLVLSQKPEKMMIRNVSLKAPLKKSLLTILICDDGRSSVQRIQYQKMHLQDLNTM